TITVCPYTTLFRSIQGRLLLKTVKMTVYYSDSGEGGGPTSGSTEVDRLEAEGKVYIKQDDQVATGDHGTYDMDSGIMVLTGKEVVLTQDRKSTRLNSSHVKISYAVF